MMGFIPVTPREENPCLPGHIKRTSWKHAISVSGHNSVLQDDTWPGTTWTNGMNHSPGTGSIDQPADLQSSVLPLCHDCCLGSLGINTGILYSVSLDTLFPN